VVLPRHHGGVASSPVWCRLVTTVVSPRPHLKKSEEGKKGIQGEDPL